MLTDEENSPAKIGQMLSDHGIKRRKAYIFQDLSLPGEQIWETDTIEMAKMKASPLNLIIILDP
jgi:precorrin-6B methylase 1